MTKVMISGYGKMGRMIEKTLALRGVACAGATEDVQSVDKTLAADCVCVDFTTPAAFSANYRFLAENFKAVVVGTTGWYDIKEEVLATFEKCGTPMIWSSNYSIGVIALSAAAETLSKILGKAGGYSTYIVEKHHIHKLDAPSGTAKTLARIMDGNMSEKTAVASVRVGELSGIHTIGFEGAGDRITIEHEAFSRQGFADGAVTAALLTEGLVGVHEFRDLVLGI